MRVIYNKMLKVAPFSRGDAAQQAAPPLGIALLNGRFGRVTAETGF